MIIIDKKLHALMFADDVMILSQSASGLKRAIGITVDYFKSMNLSVNFDKSQVMIFNARGLLLDRTKDHHFFAHGQRLKVVSEYTYLGIKLTPSGVASHGAAELFMKSRRLGFPSVISFINIRECQLTKIWKYLTNLLPALVFTIVNHGYHL